MRIKHDLIKLNIQKFADGEIRYKIGVDAKETSKLSSLGKNIGKSFAAGAAVAGAALTGVVAASIKAYADMEQNLGGVETLFKDSADIVIANAKRAYESAGMSANQYMETVTSFSASLLQGLGGDTKKAAAIADTAIIDMADNANKMGTSMELIQNAYQGFAKQNYTMLDNLKLGYGGTQSEMARLINDSGVLGDTMTVTAETVNEVSFDKIIEAIHVIQDEMGITGTTSKEAASTITGSLSSAKAAWENFLSGAGSIEDVISTFTTAGTNIMNAIVKMAPQIVQGLVTLFNALIPQIPTLLQKLLPVIIQGVVELFQGLVAALPQIITVLTEMLPQIIEMLMKGFGQIVQALSEQLPTLLPQIIDAILQLIPMLIDNLPLLISVGIQLIIGLLSGIIQATPTLLAYIPKIIWAIVKALAKLPVTLGKAGLEAVISLATALANNIFRVVNKAKELGSKIINAIKTILSPGGLANIGKNLVQGLWNGISDTVGWVLGKIKGFGKSILNGIKSIFGINSPSKEFAWIGKMNVLGLEEGMEDNIPDLNETITRTISYETTGLDYLSNGFDNYSGAVSNNILPNTGYNQPIYVTVNADMDVNKFGKAFVRDIKTFSGGTKNSYNYGGGK